MNKPSTAQPRTPRLDGQLCFALYSTGLAMTKIYRKVLKPLDVTYPQYLVLLVLWEHERLSVSDIGKHLFLDSATLTPLLKRLEAADLVARTRSSEDERQVDVSLTRKGRALQSIAPEIQQAIADATHCSDAELNRLRKDLGLLRRRLAENE
jgi:MarR family transcriptional regulator, organic hydroperoxide resistance regulator